MKILCIIPARAGSKGILNKNIINIGGHPLIAHSIKTAKQSKYISRTIVSTDSNEIRNIAISYGADVPFLRPIEFAMDHSTDREFLLHSLEYLELSEKYIPEIIVHLRPTTPLRDVNIVDKAIEQLLATKEATSLRSAHLAPKTPYKWFLMNSNGYFYGINPEDKRPEYYNLPRQAFPNVYDPNGYVDILRPDQIVSSSSIHGERILGFITPHCHELDNESDIEYMRFLFERNNNNHFI
jgi:CMP-N,N'-diacetyllegionaminic acid synthase